VITLDAEMTDGSFMVALCRFAWDRDQALERFSQ
jgi:hypothetical protein